MLIVSDHKLIDKVKITTFRNVITLQYHPTKIIETIKRFHAELVNCVLGVCCLKKEAEDDQDRGGGMP